MYNYAAVAFLMIKSYPHKGHQKRHQNHGCSRGQFAVRRRAQPSVAWSSVEIHNIYLCLIVSPTASHG